MALKARGSLNYGTPCRLKLAVFEGVGHFGGKFQVEGDIPINDLCTTR